MAILPILTIFGQTGGYTSPFGQCDTALSCPDQVYYLLGRNWDSTWPDRSTFPMAQCLRLVKKWLLLPVFTIFGQAEGYTSPFGQCDTALSCPDQVDYLLGGKKLGLNLARSEHLSYGPTPGNCEKMAIFAYFYHFWTNWRLHLPFWQV